MVRYTGPPADRQRGGQPPQSIYQTKMGQGGDKNLQATENKGVIRNGGMRLAAPNAGDDGLGRVIDTTKVTSSTPATNSLPHLHIGRIKGLIGEDAGAAYCLVLLSSWQAIIKSNRTNMDHLLANLLSQSRF
ncbi:hypothetical protein [Aeromonas veronii]|uniref:hypothetical protein n=1 Tax=Aeromonas veronii TaxID=654 RepID=UPI003F7B1479